MFIVWVFIAWYTATFFFTFLAGIDVVMLGWNDPKMPTDLTKTNAEIRFGLYIFRSQLFIDRIDEWVVAEKNAC